MSSSIDGNGRLSEHDLQNQNENVQDETLGMNEKNKNRSGFHRERKRPRLDDPGTA